MPFDIYPQVRSRMMFFVYFWFFWHHYCTIHFAGWCVIDNEPFRYDYVNINMSSNLSFISNVRKIKHLRRSMSIFANLTKTFLKFDKSFPSRVVPIPHEFIHPTHPSQQVIWVFSLSFAFEFAEIRLNISTKLLQYRQVSLFAACQIIRITLTVKFTEFS